MQLYSRVFLQILDSSIAEDYQLRHVFEDILKLADGKTGVVDMTREAMSRRLNIPLDLLNEKINKLEEPDPKSRDNDNDGRRLERLDAHRDWGWQILNWDKYDAIRTRADVALRVERHREKKKQSTAPVEGITAEQIYSEYPLKVGKPAALRAIRKAAEKVAPEKLLEITKAFAARRNGDTAFMPHPATWFNQERYNDDASTWTKNETSANQSKASNFPKLSEIQAYAVEKWPLRDLKKICVDYFGYRGAQKWVRKNGTPIDWKIDFSEQVVKKGLS